MYALFELTDGCFGWILEIEKGYLNAKDLALNFVF